MNEKKRMLSRVKHAFPLCLLVLLLCTATEASAQKKAVSGTVYDENGVEMIGVAVYDAENLKSGVITDNDGKYTISVGPDCKAVTVSCMGYITEIVPLEKAGRIELRIDNQSIQETVVTGIFTRKKDSFTGAVQTISSEDLKRVGNANVIQSLKNLDPSLMVMANLEQGSNPNTMATLQLRGASTLVSETTSLKSDFLDDANTPLFVLDGFETNLEKIQDMDMNRIQSITILKDASAKAIYGSKGANGVIVIETKALTNERTRVTYTGSMTFEAPDLTSYNLCNARQKLEIERREGYYENLVSDSESLAASLQLYNDRLKTALEGESTYWLSKPLRMGIGNKHSIGIELGDKNLKSYSSFSYNNVQGTMKGSYRKVFSGDMNLSYRKDKWLFRDIMSISYMNSEDSPYGSFDEYTTLNPYYSPYDSDGNIKKILYSGYYTYNGKSISLGNYVVNPMYNATIGTKSESNYLDFTNNFYAQYQLLPSTKIVARFGIDTERTYSEEFEPADHTDYANVESGSDDYLSRGKYDATHGSYTTFSGDVSAQFNHTFNKLHDVFATAQYNISQTKYDEVENYTEGFPNSNMTSITYARQYATDKTPTGSDGLNRNLGVLLTGGYSYDNRYMADATIKESASSVFGTDNRWGTFWSLGLAWNLHNEQFLKSKGWIKELKIRSSVGTSGNQSYTTNTSLPVYTYYNSKYYNNFTGAILDNMENENLGWEAKMDYDLGIDFRTERLNSTIDFYISDTKNMVFSRGILPSTGFDSVSDNLGKVRNKGVEISVSYTVYQSGSSYVSVLGKVAYNDNKILKISDALRNYNKQQQESASKTLTTSPIVQYYDGMPMNSIWAVRSLGIDPVSGNEIFLDKDGNMTDEWSAGDLVNCGSSDPRFNGNFGFNGEIKGFGASVIFTFYGGGKLYNTTLLNKVENTEIENNVDKRIFDGRWYYSGQVAKYRDGSGTVNAYGYSSSMTKATTRFVQRNNVMSISSVSFYYEFPMELVRKLKMERLRATLYANDLATFSSIDIERGTSYPYAKSFSISLTATF
ncbi:MAG: SusC/RagA family TonB-linked outer membrane protein [Bacteroidales bacterium]|jgi:TonB-linked SusC/RagA family outer membrane protein|nr:SusC/RagA family TonB-linked outer membrane protein [Bacteroidales bacterium]MCI1784736.1 SusC/RagA family TonB-linked outer membrane protein [Bacteroidales bacterium]